MELLIAFVLSLIAAEVYELLPALAELLVRRHAAKLPSNLAPRMCEEWLAEVGATRGHFRKVIFALGLSGNIEDLVRAHDEKPVGNGTAALKLTAHATGPSQWVVPSVFAAEGRASLTGVAATGSVGTVKPLITP